MNEISVEIKKHFGVLKRMENGWTRELNLVAWNNGIAKFDIRDWSPDHSRMSRGITLTAEAISKLTAILNNLMAEIDEELEEEEDE